MNPGRAAGALAAMTVLVAGCGSSGSHDAGSQHPSEHARASSKTVEESPRVLVPAAVEDWPTVRRETCDGYHPTHPQELLLVTRLTPGCSETEMLSSGQTLFLSVATGRPGEPENRKDYDRWGTVGGHEVLVLARGDELRSASAVLAATVPTTGESALLLGQPIAGAWPYDRS